MKFLFSAVTCQVIEQTSLKKITPTGQILLKCGVRFDPKGFVLGSHHPLKKLSYKDSSNIEVWFGDWHSTKLSGLTASVLPFYNRDKEPVRKKTALRNAMFKVKKKKVRKGSINLLRSPKILKSSFQSV